jgi:RNA polymerase sigma-54 factor
MALEIKQSLKLSQQLVMTPQLQQAIKLLQLNRLELADVVTQELMENPLLEEVAETIDNPEGIETGDRAASSDPSVDAPLSETTTGEEFTARKDQQEKLLSGKEEFDWENYIEDLNNNNSPLPSTRMNTEDLPSFENILTKTTTLTDHLLWQLNLSQFSGEEKKFGDLVIGNLSDDGYLLAPIEDVAREAGLDAEDAEEVLKMMQKFDPIGVCSRNLQECLMVQASFMKPRNEMVEKIIQNHLPDLEKKNYQSIVRALGVPMEEIVVATKIILEFEPKPGRSFVGSDNTQYITPDIYVYKVGGEFVITLNEDGMPKLRVSSYYKNVLSNAKAEGNVTKEYIQDKLRAAVWLIRSIHNRQKTIYKVTESIVKHQRDFFDKGVDF